MRLTFVRNRVTSVIAVGLLDRVHRLGGTRMRHRRRRRYSRRRLQQQTVELGAERYRLDLLAEAQTRVEVAELAATQPVVHQVGARTVVERTVVADARRRQ